MKPILLLASALTFFGTTLTSCVHPAAAKAQPICGFSHPPTMAYVGICNLAAEHYVRHHEWPTTSEQLAAQQQILLKEAEGDLSEEEAAAGAEFLNHFEFVKLQKKDEDLVIRYRFKYEGETVNQGLVLHPEATVDEIIQSGTVMK